MANRKLDIYKGKRVTYDPTGWVSAQQFKPVAFDLVELEDERHYTRYGWWTGTKWDAAYTIISTIVRWRPMQEILARNYLKS